jgi:hypothetical protein
VTQLGIFEAHQRRDEGIARAEAGALESFKTEAYAALRAYLETHATMHVDDLAPHLPALPGDRRALGPVFLRAVRAGIMEGTSEFKPSAASNGSVKRVWRSLIHRGQP